MEPDAICLPVSYTNDLEKDMGAESQVENTAGFVGLPSSYQAEIGVVRAKDENTSECDNDQSIYIEDLEKAVAPDETKCDVCKQTFSCHSELVVHYRKHTEGRRFKCDTCPRQFSKLCHLKYHLRVHTHEKPFSCSHCSMTFSQNSYLAIHMKRHTSEFECTICGRRFARSCNFKAHLAMHGRKNLEYGLIPSQEPGNNGEHGEKEVKGSKNIVPVQPARVKIGESFSCDFCNKLFPSFSKVVVHYRCHTGERPYQCTECTKNFRTAKSLKLHLKHHASTNPFKCDLCNERFCDNDSLVAHKLEQHSEEKPFGCKECNVFFAWPATLKKHQDRSGHQGKIVAQSLKCKLCRKYFTNSDSLASHMTSHSAGKKYVCKICGRGYSMLLWLNDHVKSHETKKLIECHICKKVFPRPGNLQRHMVVHAKPEKPFKCLVCIKSYTKKYSLDIHSKTHSGGSKITCQECKKTFVRSYDLRRHMYIHSREKRYMCVICRTSFLDRDEVTSHLQAGHSDGKSLCNRCGADFSGTEDLMNHMVEKYLVDKRVITDIPVFRSAAYRDVPKSKVANALCEDVLGDDNENRVSKQQ